MRIFQDLNDLPKFRNSVLTIGSFDGVHGGHQKILEKMKALAQQIDGESIVITFHPHPRFVLKPDQKDLKLLTSIEEKAVLLEKYGVDNLVIVPFSSAFSQQSPAAYIDDFLVKNFQPKYIVIGYDHRFGKDRAGDFNLLKTWEQKGVFQVFEIAKQELDDIAISSTKIRKAIENQDISTANQLLGHDYVVAGKVVEGQKIGRTIGFPTANIEVSEMSKLIPPQGIYAARANVKGNTYNGMLYIGNRPTIEGFDNQTIEINLFDFNEDIYGAELRLEIVAFLRQDEKFSSLEGLQNQLALDKIDSLNALVSKKKTFHTPPLA